jgi:hypothetical protein
VNQTPADTREKNINMTRGGVPMDPLWRTALWQQFGATSDMLENALLACPSTLWQERLWSDHADHADHPASPSSPQFDAFWSLTHHTLFWLDFNLTGSLEGFTPPTPFTVDEEGAPERIPPEQPYPGRTPCLSGAAAPEMSHDAALVV